jgi:hypothetical protein
MKKYGIGLVLLFMNCVAAQEFKNTTAIEADYFAGNIILHSPDLAQLITGHPEGYMLSYANKTHGAEDWHSLYNYPDYGGYFLYQNFKNDILGKCYAVGAFYNFYFFNRKVVFKFGQGVAMATNPNDSETNNKNKAIGSRYLGNTVISLNYRKDNVIDKFGFQAGLLLTHFSNGKMKSPNRGLNTWNVTVGLNYNFDTGKTKKDTTTSYKMKFTEPIRYNFVFRTGVNESPVVGSGQKPFYHFGFYADKRINRKSSLQLGAEYFVTTSFKEYIRFRSIAYPEDGIDANTDYKRASIFVGHELFINKISIEAQIGYYIYQPFKNGEHTYDRLGMKYYITDKVFTGASIKTNNLLAEAFEIVVGLRL